MPDFFCFPAATTQVCPSLSQFYRYLSYINYRGEIFFKCFRRKIKCRFVKHCFDNGLIFLDIQSIYAVEKQQVQTIGCCNHYYLPIQFQKKNKKNKILSLFHNFFLFVINRLAVKFLDNIVVL